MYVKGLRPLEIFLIFSVRDLLYTSESDVYRLKGLNYNSDYPLRANHIYNSFQPFYLTFKQEICRRTEQ